jgi:hypothetical protein
MKTKNNTTPLIQPGVGDGESWYKSKTALPAIVINTVIATGIRMHKCRLEHFSPENPNGDLTTKVTKNGTNSPKVIGQK